MHDSIYGYALTVCSRLFNWFFKELIKIELDILEIIFLRTLLLS